METLRDKLLHDRVFSADPLADRLVPILTGPTGLTSSGFPYLRKAQWDVFRDTVPHLLGMGHRVLGLIARAEEIAANEQVDAEARDHCARACRVARRRWE